MKKIYSSLFFCFFLIIANGQTSPAPKPTLEDFVGRYVFPDGSVVPDVTVALSDGALSMTSTAGSSALVELGVDSFSVVEFSGVATFKRGDDKKVNAVHIEAAGYILDGQKQSASGAWAFIYRIKEKEFDLPRSR